MLGQVATFMDALHLTYDEVVNKIPYRNLIIMQKDKMHVATGDVIKEVSEEEFFKQKMMANPMNR